MPTLTDNLARRRWHGTEYFSGRARYRDLAVAVKVFPSEQTGPAFVLVHGIGVSARYFTPLAAALAKFGQVYLIDLPGYGSAPNPHQDVSLAEHAAVLAEFLTAYGVQNPVLVGHSMGTQIVTRLAVDSPEVSDRLVLLGTTMRPSGRRVGRASWLLFRDILREPLMANVIVVVDYLFRCGIPYYLRQLPHLLEDRIEERLPRVRAKTLVISGHRDPIATADWTQQIAELIPDAQAQLVNGPHVIMFTDPQNTARLIAEHAAR
ncbi:alpha/beta fold hydrolase [Diaminobutyricimonas sp. TR449]|uniref:alpha/beta fold hydrolase n=1 Tax=Diaminobutyricimonas sp. TR449 TaxID=2708076 RepID=UPI0014225738|nr:alpha/beta fold hydrolase [Diaminobutyricimonas sp. TR449]